MNKLCKKWEKNVSTRPWELWACEYAWAEEMFHVSSLSYRYNGEHPLPWVAYEKSLVRM